MTEKFNLWEKTPGMCEEIPVLKAYIPEKQVSDMAVVIFPGGGYSHRASHEGAGGYAAFLNEHGIAAFVCEYRVFPHMYPLPLLDARRAIRTVKYLADKYNINKEKIAVMGSSAGGHLAALVSTYYEKIEFEDTDDIDKEDCNIFAQILCYPVIRLVSKKNGAHIGSCKNLLGDNALLLGDDLTPENLVSEKTPQCFIWHTFADNSVNVINSLGYAEKLKEYSIPTELHIFPDGRHGLGLAINEDNKIGKHVAQWGELLIKWLMYIQ